MNVCSTELFLISLEEIAKVRAAYSNWIQNICAKAHFILEPWKFQSRTSMAAVKFRLTHLSWLNSKVYIFVVFVFLMWAIIVYACVQWPHLLRQCSRCNLWRYALLGNAIKVHLQIVMSLKLCTYNVIYANFKITLRVYYICTNEVTWMKYLIVIYL